MIELIDVHKRFGHLEVLKGVNLTVSKKEVVVVIGPSGSGKSTMLRCINGLEPIQKGKVIIEGEDLHGPKTDPNKIRQRIGMVFQSFNLFPHRNALQNVMMAPLKVQKKSKSEAEKIALDLLEKVGLAEKAGAFPDELSGGQQQRVAIARALAMQPDMMLFDEVDLRPRPRTGGGGAGRHERPRRSGHDHGGGHPRDGLRPRGGIEVGLHGRRCGRGRRRSPRDDRQPEGAQRLRSSSAWCC